MNITIVGGGFGGVKTALELAKSTENHITLITDKPDFQYYPAIYGAATGHNHLESWVPLKKIFAGKKNIDIRLDAIISIDPKKKTLTAQSGTSYDYQTCIFALGSVTTFFGIKGLDTYAFGIKSAEEIERLKRHLYEVICGAQVTDKHFVVVGAGPTGVELAAALGSYVARVCDHYGVGKDAIQIDLIEAAPRVLPKMHEASSKVALKRLKKLGVNVQTGQSVEQAAADSIVVNGKPISSHTVIWTSGVANHPFYKNNAAHFTFAKNGRIKVNEYMQASENVYVIGDNADTPYTGLAQTALHDALFVSGNLERRARGRALRKYKAVRQPIIVPIGENWAVCEWYGLRLHGWLGSLLRRVADFIGYSDMLPLGQALGVWHASVINSDDDIMPSLDGK